MIKRFFYCVMAALAMTSCQMFGIAVQIGNGVPLETSLELGEFDALSVSSSVDVVYTQTPGEQSATFVCDENLAEYYNIRVEENRLIVGTKPGIMSMTAHVKTVLTVNSPVLNQVKVSGSGDCTINGPVTAPEGFLIKVSGSGDFSANGDLDCRNITATVSGSGSARMAGVVSETAEFKVSGSGSLKVDPITAESIKASCSGSGDIRLTCKDAGYIEASTSGSGDIVLKGNAGSVNSSSTGSGRVNTKNLSISGK